MAHSRTAFLVLAMATAGALQLPWGAPAPSKPRPSKFVLTAAAPHLYKIQDDHTKISLRRYNSTRMVQNGMCVQCLSLVGIEVETPHRRQGRCRRVLSKLKVAADDHGLALVVENVVSKHLHELILNEMDGEPILGSRARAKGANYHLRGDGSWHDLAVPVAR